MGSVLYSDDLIYKEIASGRNGTCFLTKSNEVFKKGNFYNIENLKKLSKLYCSHFVFPNKIVYSNDGKVLGYIMDYIDGVTFSNLNRSFNMDKYVRDIYNLEYDVAELTLNKISILDAGPNNVLMSNNDEIRIIDTDFYYIDNNLYNTYIQNLYHLANTLFYPFIDIYEFKFKDEKLNKYIELLKKERILISSVFEELNNKLISKDLYSNDSFVYKKNLRKL